MRPYDHWDRPSGYAETIPDDASDEEAPPRATPEYRRPRVDLPQSGAQPAYRAIPPYDSRAARPVYRRHTRPAMPGAPGHYPGLAASSPSIRRHVRPHAPIPAGSDYRLDETMLLRAAGFHQEDRLRLRLVPDRQFQYVTEHAPVLAQYGFAPHAVMAAARLTRRQGAFVAHEAGFLASVGWLPADIMGLACMARPQRTFVRTHCAHLRAIGFSPLQIMLMAGRRTSITEYVVVNGRALRECGYSTADIWDQACHPSSRPNLQHMSQAPRAGAGRTRPMPPPQHFPAQADPGFGVPMMPPQPAAYAIHPPPVMMPLRRASTTELAPLQGGRYASHSRRFGLDHDAAPARPPRRRATADTPLTDAERLGFANMGLEQEALALLAGCSDTVRANVLVNGGGLLAQGLSFDEILTIARETPGTTSVQPAPRRRRASRPIEPADLAPAFSYLTTDDIANDPALASIAAMAPRTGSPEPVAPQRVTHPRNDGPLSEAERAMLHHAHERWARTGASRRAAEEFYRATVPATLARTLAAPQPGMHASEQRVAFFNLLMLFAGACHTEDNLHIETGQDHLARIKALTDYLADSNDPQLLRDCDAATARDLSDCGDRLAYGITAVEQVVLQRKIELDELTHRDLVESKEKLFLQPRIENIAVHLANARRVRAGSAAAAHDTLAHFTAHVEQAAGETFVRAPGTEAAGVMGRIRNVFRRARQGDRVTDHSDRESVELYAALAPLLVARGVNMVESATLSTYGHLYLIDPMEIEYALAEVHRHVRDVSDDFWAEFAGEPTIEMLLRQCFQDDLRAMRAERAALQEEADEVLFDREQPAGDGDAMRDLIAAVSGMEPLWYREKFRELLARRHLMDHPPPLAPDLAGE